MYTALSNICVCVCSMCVCVREGGTDGPTDVQMYRRTDRRTDILALEVKVEAE